MKVKLCGIKRPEDVSYMNEFKPDYVGFVFAGTKRRVSPEAAALLAEKLNPKIRKVGVFVDEEPEIVRFAARLIGLHAVQLHGAENTQYIEQLRSALPGVKIWKAVRVKNEESILSALHLPADRFLFDSFSPTEQGGTGIPVNLELIQKSGFNKPFFLAGGLNSKNIPGIIEKIRPYGVDISSGIETDGVKDPKKIEAVMRILRSTEIEERWEHNE